MPKGRAEWSLFLAVVLSSLVVMAWSWTRWVDVPQELRTLPSSTVGADATNADAAEGVPSSSTEEMLDLGETFIGAQADTTLLQVRTLAPPGGGTSADREWLGLRAEVCMHANAAPGITLTPSAWLAETVEGQRHAAVESPWLDYPPRQFPTAPVQPGACYVGWALIDLPSGTSARVETVTFMPDQAVWALSVPTAA